MATLVVTGPDGFKEEKEVVGEITIGRADNNELVLTAGGVSRRHARVLLQDGQVVVEDSGSANGTFIDGAKIKGPTPIGPGVKVVLGDYELTLKAAGARKPPAGPKRASPKVVPDKPAPPVLGGSGAPPTRTLARAGRPMTDAVLLEGKAKARAAAAKARQAGPQPTVEGPQLRGLTGPWAGKVFPINDLVTVGRVAGVTLQLDDDSVSRQHAELEPTEEGVILRDLGSANGTAVNGQPVTEEVLLTPGDSVQFGVVELQFQDRESAIPRRGLAAAGGGGRGKLILAAVALVMVILGAGLVLKLTQTPSGPVVPRPVDTTAQVVELLSVCRSYVSTELNSEPNWNKAEEACDKALDLDPINAEANQLIRRIKFEQENFSNYEAAERAMRLNREEEALQLYSKIEEGSSYYLKVKARIADAVDQTLRSSKAECDRYVRNGELRPALERCEAFMKFHCQQLSRDQLYPPPGYKLRIDDSGRLARNQWRPPDPMYRKFLRVRAKVDPAAPDWTCPVLSIIRPREKVEESWQRVEKALRAQHSEKLMWQALMQYWQGKDNDANRSFLKIVEDVSKADLHRQSQELRRDAAAVASFFKAGQTALQQNDVESAAQSFEEAWNLDIKLMGELAEKEPSFWRQNIGSDLAEKSYERGKYYADRQDPLRACKVWKTAFKYYKGNTSVNKAIGFCSTQATAHLNNAGSCEALKTALIYAVTGDGVEEKAALRKAELGCP